MKPGFIYILTKKSNTTLYVGVTSKIVIRVQQHKDKHNKKAFTARYNLNKLVYYEAFQMIGDAIAREKQLKAGSRAKKVALINTINTDWKDLFDKVKKEYGHCEEPSPSHFEELSNGHCEEPSTGHCEEPSTGHCEELSTSHCEESSTGHCEELSTGHCEEPSTGHCEEPSTGHCEESSTGHCEEPSNGHCEEPSTGHCEERSDEAIPLK